jgi:hypothetical protein
MKERIRDCTKIGDLFSVLLVGLPPGVPSACVWVAYTVWMFLVVGRARLTN